jgi:hypothetical protein
MGQLPTMQSYLKRAPQQQFSNAEDKLFQDKMMLKQ